MPQVSTASTRRWSSEAGSRPSLRKIELTCVSTVFGLRNSFSQIARSSGPRRSGRALPAPAGSVLERIVPTAPAEKLRDHVGVDDRAAVRHAADGRQELLEADDGP